MLGLKDGRREPFQSDKLKSEWPAAVQMLPAVMLRDTSGVRRKGISREPECAQCVRASPYREGQDALRGGMVVGRNLRGRPSRHVSHLN